MLSEKENRGGKSLSGTLQGRGLCMRLLSVEEAQLPDTCSDVSSPRGGVDAKAVLDPIRLATDVLTFSVYRKQHELCSASRVALVTIARNCPLPQLSFPSFSNAAHLSQPSLAIV